MIVMRNAHEIPAPGEGIGSLLNYQNGFGNEFGTEALEGALPTGRNSPQRCGYVANRSMVDRFFYDADGELLIVPQLGRLRLATELGILDIEPQQIAVIPRGLRFHVELPDGQARGYVCENFGARFRPGSATTPGQEFHRPLGQVKPSGAEDPQLLPTRRLELLERRAR